MTTDDTKRFARAIGIAADIFGYTLSDLVMEAYLNALSDLPIERVEKGIRSAIREKRFFPRPVEIRELAGGLEPTPEHEAELLTADARDQARRIGYMATPALPETVTRAIRAVFGGWAEFCGAEWSTHQQHRFREALTSQIESHRARSVDGELAASGAVAKRNDSR